ncbi:MAG: MBL fold metallo-hydrolase [Planctomycetaceae bacterium]|nr:MBL fold metallo-hydrolase [Planctomycetaceae bacterium]
MSDPTVPSLTLLGTGTSMGVPMIGCECPVCTSTDPHNHRTRTGVLIRGPQGNLLIDTSPELRVQLIPQHVRQIAGVLFTHAHADHIMGLDDLRIFGFRQEGSIPLFCEAIVEETLRRTFAYAFAAGDTLHSKPRLAFHRIGTEPIDLCGLRIQPIRLIHGRLPILGFRINDVAFCTDVSEIPDESWAHLSNLDVLILGAIRHEPHPTHFSVDQALQVIAKARPRRAYLTHISHTLEHAETNRLLPNQVALAYDGLEVML